MKNLEKYEKSLNAAVAAYNAEMTERYENGIEGLPFEDWTELDTDTTKRLIEAEKKRKEELEAALVDEKEYIRKAIPELKAIFKANGFEEADALSDEIMKLAPDYDLYGLHNSACNCFHTGMWEIWCEDFDTVWDQYLFGKIVSRLWATPLEWMDSQKQLVGYIKPFLDECKPIRDMLKAKAATKQTMS